MAALNFPEATANGQVFEADTGVIYTYIGTPPGGYWSGFTQDAGSNTLNTLYVEKNDKSVKQTITGGGGLDLAGTIQLNSLDGNAEFAGDVTVGTDAVRFTELQPNGYIYSRGGEVNGFIRCEDTSANPKFIVSGNGSATFDGAGEISISNASYLAGNRGGAELKFFNNSDTANNSPHWASIIIDGATNYAQAGHLIFTTKLSATDGTQRAICGVGGYSFDVFDPATPFAGGWRNTQISLNGNNGNGYFKGTVYKGWDGGSGGTPFLAADEAILWLEPDNDANYVTTTDVDEKGKTVETRVYNGPTLDVKERLTKADTALQTLKTAAAAAVDFAELKAAITTALADI